MVVMLALLGLLSFEAVSLLSIPLRDVAHKTLEIPNITLKQRLRFCMSYTLYF